ncbi:unnamed protein product, partial [Ectocarpus sp. 13 AM-2016]
RVFDDEEWFRSIFSASTKREAVQNQVSNFFLLPFLASGLAPVSRHMLPRNHRRFCVFCEEIKIGFANSFYCCRHSIRMRYSPGCAQAKTVARFRRSHVVGSAPMAKEVGLARRYSVVMLQLSPHGGVV